jgi:hypothetical protein
MRIARTRRTDRRQPPRVYSSLRVTPAMEAGLTDHVWTIAELLNAT